MQKADAYLVKIDSYWSNYIPLCYEIFDRKEEKY